MKPLACNAQDICELCDNAEKIFREESTVLELHGALLSVRGPGVVHGARLSVLRLATQECYAVSGCATGSSCMVCGCLSVSYGMLDGVVQLSLLCSMGWRCFAVQ